MPTPVNILDGSRGTKKRAGVTSIGQLVVAPFSYDETEFKELAVDDAVYNFYKPRAKQQFVITGMFAVGDQQITANANAVVIIYEANGSDVTTVDKILLEFVIKQDQSIPITGLNIIVNEGKWINAVTSDDDVFVTIFGYYLKVEG